MRVGGTICFDDLEVRTFFSDVGIGPIPAVCTILSSVLLYGRPLLVREQSKQIIPSSPGISASAAWVLNTEALDSISQFEGPKVSFCNTLLDKVPALITDAHGPLVWKVSLPDSC